MAIVSLTSAMLAFVPMALLTLLPLAAGSLSGYSAETEDLSVITIYDAYPKPKNPKSFASTPKKICYPDLACFSLDGPFEHHGTLPQDPKDVNVKMRLNTRTTGPEVENTQVLDWRNPQTLQDSSFDPKKPTFIFVHGFLGHIDKDWLIELMKVSLQMDDVNAIRIGWAGGARTINYPQAVADTRLVAAEVGKLIEEMVKLGADLDAFWLVGHSLGAHTMGFVGSNVPGIGRVTGLDPAEPYFEGHHMDARLDPSDATFVDVVHTDVNSIFAMGFGSAEPMGHVDYYPNGGHDQPGCDIGITDINSIAGAKQYVVCNHERSYKILIEAIRAKAEGRTCHFKAHRCSNYESYLKEECQDCGEGCTFIGPDALVTRPKTNDILVKMYLITLGKAPFCGDKFFDFSAALPSGFTKDRGQIFVKFNMTSLGGGVVEQEVTSSKKADLLPDRDIHRLVVERNNIDVDSIKEIQVRFKHYWSALDPSTWPIWGKAKIRFRSAALQALGSDEESVDESQQRQFCLGGEKDFELVDSKDDEWTTITRCVDKRSCC